MSKKWAKSLSDGRADPSAIFELIDTAALCSWSQSPFFSNHGSPPVTLYTDDANSMDFFHTSYFLKSLLVLVSVMCGEVFRYRFSFIVIVFRYRLSFFVVNLIAVVVTLAAVAVLITVFIAIFVSVVSTAVGAIEDNSHAFIFL